MAVCHGDGSIMLQLMPLYAQLYNVNSGVCVPRVIIMMVLVRQVLSKADFIKVWDAYPALLGIRVLVVRPAHHLQLCYSRFLGLRSHDTSPDVKG
jgi:hypothetical protein